MYSFRKSLSLILILLLIFSICGCRKNPTDSSTYSNYEDEIIIIEDENDDNNSSDITNPSSSQGGNNANVNTPPPTTQENYSVCQIKSVDSNIVFDLEIIDKVAYYNVSYKGETLYKRAKLGLKINDTDYSKGVKFKSVQQTSVSDTITLNGRFKNTTDQYTKADVTLTSHGETFTLEVRVYNDGVAFRMKFDRSAGTTVNAEYTSYNIDPNSYVYASFGCRRSDCQQRDSMAGYEGSCYEALYGRFSVANMFAPTQEQWKINGVFKQGENYLITPMAIEFPKSNSGKQYYGAILEGNVTDYVGTTLRQLGGGQFSTNTTFQSNAQFVDFKITGRQVITPYRILTIGENLNDLYNNSIVYSVNEAPSGDYSWVKPGKATWSWRSNGGKTGTIDLMYAYSDAAAKMGFEYNLIDSGWPYFKKNGKSGIKAIADLCTHSKPYGVEQLVWAYTPDYGTKVNTLTATGIRPFIPNYNDLEEFCESVAKAGVVGVKFDFFTPEDQVDGGVNIYEKIAQISAKHKLILNFHGATKPTGLNRTYPNVLNYEAIFGHEMEYAYTSSQVESKLFTTQYLTRGLAGHADYTPHVLNGLGWAELVFVEAPFNAIDAKPDELLNSPATEFIKSIPTVWDTTKVLSCSKFGEYAAIARCKDGNWYLGAINAKSSATNTQINLGEFLTDGGEYILDLYTDSGVSSKRVTKNDVITLNLAAYSGCAARISKAKMSSYGGEYTSTPITLELTDGCTAYYTTNGSTPTASSAKYNGSIELDKSSRVNIIVVNPAGSIVSRLSYRFNKF